MSAASETPPELPATTEVPAADAQRRAPAADAAPPSRTERRKRLIREYGEGVLLALAVALAARLVAAETFRIPTASMFPALFAGDHVLVSKISYGLRVPFTDSWLVRWREVRRGDVVVFEHPTRPGEVHVKRVVGVPGDVVEFRRHALYVNGAAQPRERVGAVEFEEQSNATRTWWTESCVLWREQLSGGDVAAPAAAYRVVQCRDPAVEERQGPYAPVEPGHVFVVGDNRDRSEDSRVGAGWQVPMTHVIGKAVRVLWSWGPDGARTGSGQRFRDDRLFKAVE